MGSDVVRWVHLSDLHLEKGALPEIQGVLKLLWQDLGEQIKALGGPLNFAVFSGDLVKNGLAEEYVLATKYFIRPLLDTTHLTASQLYLVPGNHDVSWKNDALLSRVSISQYLQDAEKANELWTSLGAALIQTRMAAFAAFSKKRIQGYTLPACTASHTVTVDAHTIRLTLLNSAWMSGLILDRAGEVHDPRNLLLTSRQVRDALEKSAPADVRIMIMHHPLDWLAEEDKKRVEPQIAKACDILLHGHLHQLDCQVMDHLHAPGVVIPSGTARESADYLNGYNLVELDLQTGCGVVVFRRYRRTLPGWTPDTESTGDDLNGYYPFVLRKLFTAACGGNKNPDLHALELPYRETPSNSETGFNHYWHVYNLLQTSSEGLRLLARMVRFQQRWLKDAEAFAILAESAAYLAETPRAEAEAEAGLRELLDGRMLPPPIAFDVHFLMGLLLARDGAARADAIDQLRQATELGRAAWVDGLQKEDLLVIRDKRARAFLQLALLARDDRTRDDEVKATDYLRWMLTDAALTENEDLAQLGINLLAEMERNRDQPERKAAAQKGAAQKAIEPKAAAQPSRRAGLRPEEERLWQMAGEAIAQGNRGDAYFLSTALHHGLGYEKKRIEVEVQPDGSATLIGSCVLLATRNLVLLDTYLQPVPVQNHPYAFTDVSSGSVNHTLRYMDVSRSDLARVAIVVDPPLRCGEQLTYTWRATARPGTIATMAAELSKAAQPFEWIAWQVIVPIKRLEIVVRIPSAQHEPLPKVWSELWRIGPVPKPSTDAYLGTVEAAYRVQTGEGFGSVSVVSELLPPDRRQLELQVDYPWLAFRQVLAWEVY